MEGSAQASASVITIATSEDDEIEAERGRCQAARLLLALPATLLGREADHGRRDPDVEQADEREDGADHGPDPVLLGAERIDDDRCQQQAADDRDGVDAVDQHDVAAQEAHYDRRPADRRDDAVPPSCRPSAPPPPAAAARGPLRREQRGQPSERGDHPCEIRNVRAPEAKLDRQIGEEVVEVRVAGDHRDRTRCRLVDDLVQRPSGCLTERRIDDCVD